MKPQSLWLLLALATACSRPEGEHRSITPGVSTAPIPKPASSATGMETMTVEENTQATIDELKIGVANVWDEDYVDLAGATKHGTTAGFFLFLKGDASKDQKFRVFPGQKITLGRFKIEIQSVAPTSVTFTLAK